MRNSTSASTPKTTKTAKDESSSTKSAAAEKTSAKKLKQARLPFKVIAPGTSPVGSKAATTLDVDKVLNKDGVEIKNGHNKEPSTITTSEGRKRKLSYDSEGDNDGTDCNKDNEADDNVSKENVEVLAAASKKKKLAPGSDGTSDVIVSLLDDDSNDAAVAETSTVVTVMAAAKDSSLKTPKVVVKEKRKGAGTPQTSSSSSAQKDKSGSASKLQIKLPLSAGKKNKRRKSKLLQLAANASMNEGVSGHNNSCAESSDDIEEVASKLNPLKRKKLDIEAEDQQDAVKDTIVKKQDVETIALDSESETEEDNNGDKQKVVKESSTATNQTEKKKSSEDNEKVKSKENHQEAKKEARTNNNNTEKIKSKSAEKSPEKQEGSQIKNKLKESKKDNKTNVDTEKDANTSAEEVEEIAKISDSSDDEEEKSQDKEDLNESVQSDNDNEADDERENMAAKSVNISSDLNEDPKSKHPNTVESLKDTDNASTSTKNLTPKQIKLLEQRRKAREEKERKLQEEKMKKQHEKEEKEQAKKREREEKEEQKKKEREEKEEQKKKEREEKERKRLAEVEAKNEEKRKKNEAKEEEIRKKEEERKRKEQEKEEAELKKKKAAQAFTKFFVPKAPSQTQVSVDEDSNTGDGSKLLAFRPFQVKGDMKLAPLCRKVFSEEAKCRLDSLIGCRHKKQTEIEDDDDDEEDIVRRKPLNKSQLYLSELRSGKILPGKWRRPSTESKDDVIIVEDDLERVGQAIVEDTPAYVREQMRVKLYKFHDNRRPPYYGTWRKKSTVIKPTKPFEQDKKFFDYEVDSDDEWEEEEPGESLEDGSDDDKEKESGDDDDYEVDNKWFVPHGHLSDEEMQNEDECGGMGDNNTREAQKAKLQILQQEFAQEMKKKTEKIKPRLIGCIWVDKNGNQPIECAKIIWDTLQKKAMLLVEPPLVEEPEVDKSTEPSSPSAANANADKQPKNIVLSENMVKDLTRLIHGNNHSKNFLINEYLAFVEKTEDSIKNGDLRKPLKSVIRDKIDEMAEWQSVDATAASVQEMEQAPNDDATESTKKKKKSKRRLCWVVKQEMLDKMDLSSLELQNSWEYTLPPKFLKADKDIKTDEATTTSNALPNTTNDTSSTISIPPAKLEETKTKTNTSQITKFTKVLTAEEKANKLKNPTQPPSTPSSPSTTNSNIIENKASTPTSKTGKEKKRVPLLMSVARGQQISTPAKNKLISQFLQKDSNDNTSKASSSPTSRSSTRTNLASSTSPTVEDDDIVILD